METKKSNEVFLTEILETLNEEKISSIDFDQLAERIKAIRNSLIENEGAGGELEILRQDYIRRIAGMVKAVAVANDRSTSASVALETVDSLDNMSAEELVSLYRKTSASFRTVFPASFGLYAASDRTGRGGAARKIK